jgi:hypothetical protein
VAAAWLAKKCPVVITEMASATQETPDAIGWQGARSIVVECKVSRADFLADGKKFFRANPAGMGRLRYFLAPPGVIREDDIPPLWGVLEITGPKIRVVREAQAFSEWYQSGEVFLLQSAIRRVGPMAPKGCSVKFYTIETKNRATIGVEL